MKTYKIPISWESYKTYEVEAENLEKAIEIALKEFLSEPDDNYLSDSFDIDDDIIFDDYPKESYNKTKIWNNL
jgi:hypothetical protein